MCLGKIRRHADRRLEMLFRRGPFLLLIGSNSFVNMTSLNCIRAEWCR